MFLCIVIEALGNIALVVHFSIVRLCGFSSALACKAECP